MVGFPPEPDMMIAMLVVPMAAALYVRLASSVLRPGLLRLAALLPVLAFLAAVPLAFSSPILRGIAAVFLAWICLFKVALLAVGNGPLGGALPVLPFLFTASLPVMPRRRSRPPGAKSRQMMVSLAAKVGGLAVILQLNQLMRNRLDILQARLALYAFELYCFLDLLLASLAAIGGVLCETDMERPFDRPQLSSSLSDFWGRRWNLVISGVLRASVYEPMKARAGRRGGIMATFIVSGLMHEAVWCYITLRWRPTGAMLAYFLLNGAGRVAEDWGSARGLRPPPRAVRTLLVWVFLTSTTFWIILPLIPMSAAEEAFMEDWAAVTAFFQDAGRYLTPYL